MTDKSNSYAKYTLGEELLNSVSHGLGAVLALTGSILLIIKAVGGSGVELFSVIIFGISMTMMYTVSTVYHSLAKNRGKKVMRILDHCFIYALIIGTYAPFTLAGIGGTTGTVVFLIVFVAGALGITLTAIDMHKYAKFGFACYIAMGWTIIFAVKPLVAALDTYGLTMLIAGGVVYTLGALLYLWGKKKPYIHGTWHFFVLLGSILHFLAVYNSVII